MSPEDPPYFSKTVFNMSLKRQKIPEYEPFSTECYVNDDLLRREEFFYVARRGRISSRWGAPGCGIDRASFRDEPSRDIGTLIHRIASA